MRVRQRERIKRWLAYLLVFCMTFSCMEGMFVLRTGTVSAEGAAANGEEQPQAQKEPVDQGDELLDIVEGGRFNISIYTMDDTFKLAATNDSSLEVAVEQVPVNAKLLVRFTDISITDDVKDGAIYSMKLPSTLIPAYDDGNLARDTWTELESDSYVKSYGRIKTVTEESKDSYYFQIYFVNSATQQDIRATFQYGAELAENTYPGSTVTATFPTDEFQLHIGQWSGKDFEVTKTAVWKGTNSNKTSDPNAQELVYTITIKNLREDAATNPVSYASLQEELLDSLSYLYTNVKDGYDYDKMMTIEVDGQRWVWKRPNTSYPFIAVPDESAEIGSSWKITMSPYLLDSINQNSDIHHYIFKKFGLYISNLIFQTLTISYTVHPYYGSTETAAYEAKTSLYTYIYNPVYHYETHELTYGAAKTFSSPEVGLSVKSYDNVTDAKNDENIVSTGGIPGRFGEVAKYTAEITPGGEDWVQLTEVPLELGMGCSKNYYLQAAAFAGGGSDFLRNNVDFLCLKTAGGTEIPLEYKARYGVGYMQGCDYISYLEMQAIAQKYQIENVDGLHACYWAYTDPVSNETRYVWGVVVPETYNHAAASISKSVGPSAGALMFADDSTDGAPVGYRIFVLGLNGYTLKFSYNKFLRSIPVNSAIDKSLKNGSVLEAENSCADNSSNAYLTDSGRHPYGGIKKSGTLLSDGAVLWELELDVTAYRELMSSALSWYPDGSVFNLTGSSVTDQLDTRYVLNDNSHYYDRETLEPCGSADPNTYTLMSGQLYYWDISLESWRIASGFGKSPDKEGQWTANYASLMPGAEWGIPSGDWSALPDTLKLCYISTPKDGSLGTKPGNNVVYNTVTFSVSQLGAPNLLPLFEATDYAYAVTPNLTKTMDMDDKDSANVLHSKIHSTMAVSGNGRWTYLNGVYAVRDNMQDTTASYAANDTTLRGDEENVQQDTEAAKFILLQRLTYKVTMADDSVLEGEFTLDDSYTLTDGKRVYTDANKARLTIPDDLNMYDGFSFRILDLTDAKDVEINYWTAFDYAAYADAHPTVKRVQLNYVNTTKRDYDQLPDDEAEVTASYSGFSVAVNPDLTKDWKGASADSYGNTYTIQADVGNKMLSAVYLLDQITGIREKDRSDAETVYTEEQWQQMLEEMELTDLTITAKNRLNENYSEKVFELKDGTGECFGNWIVEAMDSALFDEVAVTEEATPLNGNVFAYRVSNTDGSIAAQTYFEITYTLRLNEREDGVTAFRHLDFYHGGVLVVDNQAVICYNLGDVVSQAARIRRYAVSRAGNGWVAAGATVEGLEYLKFPTGTKTVRTTNNGSTIKSDWTVTIDMKTVGTPEYPVGVFGDTMHIVTNVKNEEVSRRLVELLAEHMTLEVTGTEPEGVEITNVNALRADGNGFVPFFTINTENANLDYNQKAVVYYTTVIDWEGFSAAVREECRTNQAFIDTNFTYGSLKSVTFSYENAIDNTRNTVSKGSWKYPASLFGTLGKNIISKDIAAGSIQWDIHATVGGGDFNGYKIEDELYGSGDAGNILIRGMELSGFSIVSNGEIVYTYTGDFSQPTELPAVEGLWSGAELRFYTEDRWYGYVTLFELTFDTIYDGADIHVIYETNWDISAFNNRDMILGENIYIRNNVRASGEGVSLNTSKSDNLEFPPANATISKEKDPENEKANESAWTATASVGNYDVSAFVVHDYAFHSGPLCGQMKSVRVTLMQNGEAVVMFDADVTDMDAAEKRKGLNLGSGWTLYIGPLVTGSVLDMKLAYKAEDNGGMKLPAGSSVTLDYVYEYDIEEYLEKREEYNYPPYMTKLENNGSVSIGSSGSEARAGNIVDIVYLPEGLTKSGDVKHLVDEDTSLIDWTVDMHLQNYYTLAEIQKLGEVVMTDVLPEELSLQDGSVKLIGLTEQVNENKEAKYEDERYTVEYTEGADLTDEIIFEKNEDNSFNIRLDFTKGEVKNYTDFRIVYTTLPVKEYESISNSVELRIGGTLIDETADDADPVFERQQKGTVTSKIRPITFSLEAAKYLDGVLSDQEFRFSASEVDEYGNSLGLWGSYKTNVTDKNSENYGKVVFDEITYNEEGVHYYKISEDKKWLSGGVQAAEDGVLRDEFMYTIKVEVSIDETTGGYQAIPSIYKVWRGHYLNDGSYLDPTDYTYEDLAFYNTRVTAIDMRKLWDDADDQDGKRPAEIQVQLYADGEAYGEPRTLESRFVGLYWGKLPVNKLVDGVVTPIEYSVKEVTTVPGYEAPVYDMEWVKEGTAYGADYGHWNVTITNTHEPETVEKTVTKVWDDDDNRDRIRPESIRVYLYADNQTNAIAEEILSEANNWTVTWTNLPKYANGTEINYTVLESAVEKYTPDYTATVDPSSNDVEEITVTNKYTPEKTSVSGRKIWEDENDQDGVRPESITINLYADGVLVDSRVVTAEDGWSWSFTDLNKNADGREIIYTITEDEAEGYTTEYIRTENGYDVKNTHEVEKTSVSGSKTWIDADNQDGIRPESITISLYADNVLADSKVVTAEDNWSWTFENLDKYARGQEIVYSIIEDAAEGYTPEYVETENGIDVINTHEAEKISVSGSKTWIDENNQDGIRPESITISLYADNVLADSKVVTAEDDWSWTFEKLDKYADGQEIIYTITEDAVEGYTTEYVKTENGIDVINTHEVEKTSVSGSKTWIDENDQDGVRPESITINLYADNVLADSKVVTAEDDWSWNFENLDRYANGTEIIYTITEDAVAGYTTIIDGYNVTNTHKIEETETTPEETETTPEETETTPEETETTPEETETTPEETETTPEETETTPEETETTPEETETTPEETETTPEETETTPEETETVPVETESTAEENETPGGQVGDDDSGHLPITGMLVWPITVLSIMGILLMAAGMIDNRRRCSKNK